MLHRSRSLLQRLEVNRAVGYLLLSRGWQFISGIGTVGLLSESLGPQQLDLYQLFLSLIGMQMFVELGLPTIIVLLTSHEWARLQLNDQGQIEGETEALVRLANLSRVMGRWFQIGALAFFVVVAARGYGKMQSATVPWLAPWISLVVVSALAIPFVARTAILEGCQQVATINRLRLGQAVTGTLAVWTVLLMGGGLFALVAAAVVRCSWDFYIVRIRYRELFRSLQSHAWGESHILRQEIWPLGWRIALQTIGSYFGGFYLTQVVHDLKVEGATGQWGMTWQVLSALQVAALSWVNTRAPEFTLLAAQGRHSEMRQRMWKTGWIALGVFCCGVTGFLCCLGGFRALGIRAADRFLAIPLAAEMAVGYAAMLITALFHYSVRYDKRDPFLIPHTISSAAAATLGWLLGNRWGVSGVVAAYAAVAGLFTLPVAWGLALSHARWISKRSQVNPSVPAE